MNQNQNQKKSQTNPYIIGEIDLFEDAVDCCVIRCPNCRKRSRGEVGDTKRITWRCRGCKRYNYGMVQNGTFVLFVSCSFEIDLGKFIAKYKSI